LIRTATFRNRSQMAENSPLASGWGLGGRGLGLILGDAIRRGAGDRFPDNRPNQATSVRVVQRTYRHPMAWTDARIMNGYAHFMQDATLPFGHVLAINPR
jgi:hypothetical protein